MRVTAQELAAKGISGKIIDLDTGKVVRKVLWYDLEMGALEALQIDALGNTIKDGKGNNCTALFSGRFKFIPSEKKSLNILMGAPNCALCKSPLTLPGDDLCPICRANERGKKFEKLDDPFQDHKCLMCSRQAVWSVSDEIVTTPQLCGFRIETRRGRKVVVPDKTLNGKQPWTRAMTIGRRFYCERHFQPPRLLDGKGEPIKDLEMKTRPN